MNLVKILEEKFTKRAELLMYESKVRLAKSVLNLLICPTKLNICKTLFLCRCVKTKLLSKWAAQDVQVKDPMVAKGTSIIVRCAIAITLLTGEPTREAFGIGYIVI